MAERFSRSLSPCYVHPCNPFASDFAPPSSLPRIREIHTPTEEDDGSYFISSIARVRRLLQVLAAADGKYPICSGMLLLVITEMQRKGTPDEYLFDANCTIK